MNVTDGDEQSGTTRRDTEIRGWLAAVGAPLAAPGPQRTVLSLEEVLAEGVALSHRDATVARVLPVVLWKRRHDLDLRHLVAEATRRDEGHALGFFLELAGELGGDSALVEAARRLSDGRRRKPQMFFTGPHGPHQLASARRNTPREALRWGFLMNVGRDSFESIFDKFAERR